MIVYYLINFAPPALLVAPLVIWIYIHLRTARHAQILAAIILSISAVLVAMMIAAALTRLPDDHWSASRLVPGISLFNGYRLYYDPGDGPVLVRMYGPVPWLMYAPSALLGNPTAVMVAGVVINLVSIALPLLWYVRRTTKNRITAAVAIAIVSIIAAFSPPMLETAASITIDAPAIGFTVCACAVVASATTTTLRKALICGIFAALAVWSKQTVWPMVAGMLCFAWLAFAPREAFRFSLAFVATIATFSAFVLITFGMRQIIFNMYTIPATQPWQWPWLTKPAAMLRAGSMIVRESYVSLIVLCASLLLVRESRRGWFARNPWICLIFCAIAILPATAAAFAKIGGRANNAAAAGYLLALAAAIVLARATDSAAQQILAGRTRLAWLFAMVFTFALPASAWRDLRKLPQRLANYSRFHRGDLQLAYEYALQNPGAVYFPQHPLATLLAEGRLDHFEEGVLDLQLAGFDLSNQQLRAHLPPNLRAIAYRRDGPGLMAQKLGGDLVIAATPPQLPGWTVMVFQNGITSSNSPSFTDLSDAPWKKE